MLAHKGRRLKRTERKGQAITNDWHWWTMKEDAVHFFSDGKDCVNIFPACCCCKPYRYLPGSPIFFLPPALVLLGNQQFHKGLMQYKCKTSNSTHGLKRPLYTNTLKSTHIFMSTHKILSSDPQKSKQRNQVHMLLKWYDTEDLHG